MTPSPGSGADDCELNICYHNAAFVIPFNLICNMTIFWKVELRPFETNPWVRGRVCSKIVWFPLIWYAKWPCFEKVTFDLLPEYPGSKGRLLAKHLLPCCCIYDSLTFDMQHDIVLKKMNFDLLTPRVRRGLWAKYLLPFCASNKFNMQQDHVLKNRNFDLLTLRSGVGVCEQNSCYHVVTLWDSIWFDMQHDTVLVRLNFDLLTSSPRNVCVCLGMEGVQAKYLLPCWGLGVQAKHLLPCFCNHDSL